MEKVLRVLIVEDSENDALLLILQLKRDGYNPICERVETLDQLASTLDKHGWDIIISDYVLPEFSGLETLQMLRSKGLDIPCLIVSGKIGEETAVAAMRAGAKDYITKDNLKLLGPTVERVLADHEVRRKQESAEKALRENEKLSSILLNSAPNPIIVFNADFSIRSVNPVFGELTGFSPEQVAGLKGPFPWWPPEKTAQYLKDFNKIPFESNHRESLFKKKNGELFWVNILSSAVKNEKEETEYYISIWTNVTAEKRLRQELELFNHRIIQAQEEERKRIARELHEDTTQILAIIKLELESLLQSQDIKSQATLEKLGYLRENTDHALQDVRRYSYALRPGELDHLGLEVALEQLTDNIGDPGKLETQFTISGEPRKLTDDIGLVLFRITQEALNNVRRHSRASMVSVSLDYRQDRICLIIKDNGRGFEPETESICALDRGNLGLISMRERAKLIGANFSLESKITRGTKISVEVRQ